MVGLDLVLGGRQTTTLGPDMTGLGLTSGAGGGVPLNALTLNGQPITLNGQYITITQAA